MDNVSPAVITQDLLF